MNIIQILNGYLRNTHAKIIESAMPYAVVKIYPHAASYAYS